MQISSSTLNIGDSFEHTKYATSTGTSWYTVSIDDKDNEEDIFKQITSLLGLKIINVSITKEKIELICKRRTKKFRLEIRDNKIFIFNGRDKLIIGIKLPEAMSHDYVTAPYNTGDYTTVVWKYGPPLYTGVSTYTEITDKLDKY